MTIRIENSILILFHIEQMTSFQSRNNLSSKKKNRFFYNPKLHYKEYDHF